MAKSKSSASSGTRKKNALKKKARETQPHDDDRADDGAGPPSSAKGGAKQPPQRGQKKVKKDRFAPKVKSYIPPPPPPKGASDPVDLYLAGGSAVDAELVVVLRRLAKKDEATISKGVEGLEAWVRQVLKEEMQPIEEGDEWKLDQRREELAISMDVWAHHFHRLALHPSRRLRLRTHTLHGLLTSKPRTPSSLLASTRAGLLAPLWLDQKEYVGAWCCSGYDGDRAVRSVVRRSWDGVVLTAKTSNSGDAESSIAPVDGVDLGEHAESIMDFAAGLILTNTSEGSSDDALDDPSLLKTQALLTISYLLSTLPSPLPLSESALNFLTSEEVWELTRPTGSAALRRALYELLGAAAERKDEELLARNDGLRVIATNVLQHCWEEDEGWAGSIAFLRRYPEAWSLADSVSARKSDHDDSSDDDDDEDEGDDESDDDDAVTQAETGDTSAIGSDFKPSPTLSRFFGHLALACSGHPQNYPTVLLLLSTMPTSVLPTNTATLSVLFESFWAAWGGRALTVGSQSSGGGPSAIEEFVTAFLECLLFELQRLQKEGEEGSDELVVEWIGRTWRTFLGVDKTEGAKRHRGIATPAVATQIASTLTKIANKDETLFKEAWSVIADAASQLFAASAFASDLDASLQTLAMALAAFNSANSDLLRSRGRTLAAESLQSAATGVTQDESGERTPVLLAFISSGKVTVADDAKVQKTLDQLATERGASLLSSGSASATLAFLTSHLGTTSIVSRNAIWSSLFRPMPSSAVLASLLDAVSEGSLSSDLPSAKVDDYVLEIADRVLGEDSTAFSTTEFDILIRLMVQPQPFISVETPIKITGLVAQVLPSRTKQSLALSPSAEAVALLVAPSRLLAQYSQFKSNAHAIIDSGVALTVFEIAHVVPKCRLEDADIDTPAEAIIASQQTWSALLDIGGSALAEQASARLSEHLQDAQVQPSPIELVECAANLSAEIDTVTLDHVLPTPKAFSELVDALSLSDPASSVSILDPLVPQSTDHSDLPRPLVDADAAGFSSFVRCVVAALEVAARDHAWLRRNLWVLPHVLMLGGVARDELAASESTRGVFGSAIRSDVLERIVASCDGLAAYSLSAKANNLPSDWHTRAVMQLRKKEAEATDDELIGVLDGLARRSKDRAGVYARRGFSTVLQAILRYADAGVADAERWLAFAQNLGEAHPLTLAIIYSVKDVLVESPRFERYQNELAANLAGVNPAAASKKGLVLLRVLLATAPPPEAPVIFLPQQRSMFLIQNIQRWISSDEDLAEEIHSAVAELFIHLAPIVQDMSGSHWDLMFDIIESNLETASWDDMIMLAPLYHSCRLVATIQDLATRNKDLRVIAKERVDKSLALIRDLFVSRPDSKSRDQPRIIVLEIMAWLMRDLPPTLLTMGKPFDQLLRLLQDPSLAVQQSAYNLVTRIAAQHVTDFVVEVELDQEGTLKGALPDSLINLLSEKLPNNVLHSPEHYTRASTLLLSWLVAFTFFDNASPRLKADYANQLRKLELVGLTYLPSIFALLNLSDRSRAIDISPWGIDEFYLELVDELSSVTLPAFATFVYYRSLQAIPSLVRQWWEGCKNRQLSMAVANFTSRHFSPVLIAHELAHLRDPNDPAGKALRDNEDFTVKVAAGANEVKAVFVVDEESMEIGVRLPAEFPLQQVEVKDVRKVGVTDSQWRAWLLGVQQVITNQNGLIADALSLFKRNVTLHFEGVEACAICYSSISVVDRSLPTKACKTCNNRFHAGCLYKWFSTSHGSSCPLCRSLF